MRNKYKIPLIATVIFAQLGSSVLSFVLSLAVLRKTNSATAFSFVVVISSIVTIVATPFVGILVDKYNKKLILFLSQTVSITALIVFFVFLHYASAITTLAVCVLNIFLNLSDSMFFAALLASAVYMVNSAEDLDGFNSIEQSADSTCSLIGPLIAGAMYSMFTVPVFVLIEIASELLALVAVSFIHYRQTPIETGDDDSESVEPETDSFTLQATLKYIWRKKIFMVLCLGMILINFLFAALNVGLPYITSKLFSSHTFLIGVIEMSMPMGLIVASTLYPSMHYRGPFYHPIVVSWIGFGFLMMLIGLAVATLRANYLAFAVALVLITVCMGMFNTVGRIPMIGYFQQSIPSSHQGRVFAIVDVIAQITTPLGTVLFGVLFDHASPVTIFTISGLVMVVLMSLLFFVERQKLRDSATTVQA